MNLIDETRNLERRNFSASQRLLDVDLNDREAFHREMRWLHNRSLHQPGVGNGYQIVGAKGDRTVMIGPGYAIDAYGREIVLNRSVEEPIPPVAGEANGTQPSFFYLAVSYPDDSRLDEAEVRLGTCGTRGPVRLSERPLLCWVPLTVDKTSGAGVLVPDDADLRRDVNAGMLIVLALVEVFQCRLNRNIDERSFLPRRTARPPRLPYTASAVEVKPDWVAELIGLPASTAPTDALAAAQFRLRATVKTVGATFGAIPRYLARVSDSSSPPFIFEPNLGPVSPLPKDPVYVDPRVDVVLDDKFTDHTKLTVSVSLLVYHVDPKTSLFFDKAAFDKLGADEVARRFAERWSIVWLGIEG